MKRSMSSSKKERGNCWWRFGGEKGCGWSIAVLLSSRVESFPVRSIVVVIFFREEKEKRKRKEKKKRNETKTPLKLSLTSFLLLSFPRWRCGVVGWTGTGQGHCRTGKAWDGLFCGEFLALTRKQPNWDAFAMKKNAIEPIGQNREYRFLGAVARILTTEDNKGNITDIFGADIVDDI